MRYFHLLIVLALVACTTKPTPIGTACEENSDCTLADQKCMPTPEVGNPAGSTKICTRPCTSQIGTNGCPLAYDCGVLDPAIGPTCNKITYAVDTSVTTQNQPLLYGKRCSKDADCAGIDGANATPTCRKGPQQFSRDPLAQDPNAYCTGGCVGDSDCPYTFVCQSDYDKKKKCLPRGLCAPCSFNENCQGLGVGCVPTADGTAKYCTKTCNNPDDCPGTLQGSSYMKCSATVDAAGVGAKYCLHAAGACAAAGEICDPCRSDDDCPKAKSFCFLSPFTLESFCTIECSGDSDCRGPNPALCDPNLAACDADANAVFTCHY